jgi:hypothetical protein
VGSNHEKKKKIPPKNNVSRPTHNRSSPMDRPHGPGLQNKQKLDSKGPGRPCSDKTSRGVAFYPKVKKDNLRLAKEFYWCDERSFYEMGVPLEEAKQFALASYTFQDADPEVLNFLPRVRQAQKAALQYCAWLIRAENMGV